MPEKIKACILAAGEGKRLAPITETQPKPMFPIAGKPLIQHTIEMLHEIGVEEILLVVGYLKEKIQGYFGSGEKFNVKITYIEQKEFLGTAHATNLAKDFAGKSPLFLIYGDLFMDLGVFIKASKDFTEKKCQGLITAIKVEDPTKFGILKSSKEGFLEQIVEKPVDDRFGKLANAGVYLFTPEIFIGIAETQKSTRGEYELTESIQRCIDKGSKYFITDISEYYWSDVGHPWQLLEANQHILSKLQPIEKKTDEKSLIPANIINHGGIIEEGVYIHGTVELGKNSILKSGTYIEGPVWIGENCIIGPQAYLRPYTTLGNGCKIGNSSEVKSSILMDHVSMVHLSYIGDSIIGNHVNIGCGAITANVRLDKKEIIMNIKNTAVNTHRKKLGTVIGDFASIGIQVNIMPGKTIGSYSQIGSGTIVDKNVPPNTLYYTDQSCQSKIIERRVY